MELDVEKTVIERNKVVTIKDWLITLLILCIPLVNIVMMFVWAFDSNVNESKANFFKAYIVFTVAVVVLSILITGMMI